jgi:hypothetical protein
MTSTITPEERAAKLFDELEIEAGEVFSDNALAIIAAAIRDAETQALQHRRYIVPEPEAGWKPLASFTVAEKAKLRPVAESLAMLDGNAFFTVDAGEGREWYEGYLAEAHAVYEANGGDNGWAGEASFAKTLKSPSPPKDQG